MTMAMRAARPANEGPAWMRCAIAHGDRITFERTLAPGASACDELEALGVRVHYHKNRWRVEGEGLEVRLGRAETRRVDGVLALEPGARARVIVDHKTAILLAEVPAPIKKTVPLPVALRGGYLAQADWRFSLFAVGSVIAHLAVVAIVLEADFPIARAMDRVAEVYFEEAMIPPDVPEEPAGAAGDQRDEGPPAAEPGGEPSDRVVAGPPSPPRSTRTVGPSPSRDEDAIEAGRDAVEAVLLGVQGLGGHVTNALRSGADFTSQEEVFAQGDRVVVASSNDIGRVREHGGDAQCEGCERDLRGLRASPAGNRMRDERAPIEEHPPVIITVPRCPDCDLPEPEPGFDPRELVRAIRYRMRAIQGCYERELTRGSPELAGRVLVSMDVMPVGTLAQVRAEENTTGSDPLAACVVRTIAPIRLRQGPSSPARASFPLVFAPQQ